MTWHPSTAACEAALDNQEGVVYQRTGKGYGSWSLPAVKMIRQAILAAYRKDHPKRDALVEKLPLFPCTTSGKPLTKRQIERLIEEVRSRHG